MKDQCMGMNVKKSEIKDTYIRNKYRYFLKSNFVSLNKLFVLVIQMQMLMQNL